MLEVSSHDYQLPVVVLWFPFRIFWSFWLVIYKARAPFVFEFVTLVCKVLNRELLFMNEINFIGFFSFRFLSRLIICKILALTYKSKGLTKKRLQLLGQHSNWMVHIQQRLFYASHDIFGGCLPALLPLYDHEVNKADYFIALLELSSNNFGKLASGWKKFHRHSLTPSCKVAGTCGIYSISGIFSVNGHYSLEACIMWKIVI